MNRFDAGALAGQGTLEPIGGLELIVSAQARDWDIVSLHSAAVNELVGAVGLHPWFLVGFQERFLDDLETRLQTRPDLAVGEIGIDSAWQSSSTQHITQGGCTCTRCIFELSQVVFSRQLELAAKYNRVCTVHCVRAHSALLDLLADFSSRKVAPKRINLHSWSASAEMTQMLLSPKSKRFQWVKERLFFGISAHVNFRGLFRFETDRGPRVVTQTLGGESQEVWHPVADGEFALWQLAHSEQVTCSPWRLNAKLWSKFVKLVRTIPPNRLLLESDVSAFSSGNHAAASSRRWNRIQLAAHVVSDALETTPESVLEQCRLNLSEFLSN